MDQESESCHLEQSGSTGKSLGVIRAQVWNKLTLSWCYQKSRSRNLALTASLRKTVPISILRFLIYSTHDNCALTAWELKMGKLAKSQEASSSFEAKTKGFGRRLCRLSGSCGLCDSSIASRLQFWFPIRSRQLLRMRLQNIIDMTLLIESRI